MKKLALALLLLAALPAWATQYARPDATDADTGWDAWTFPCNDDSLHPCLGDGADGNVCSENDGSWGKMSLSAVTDPGVDTGHRLCLRAKYGTGTGAVTAYAYLYDPVNGQIVPYSTSLTSTLTTYCTDLLESEAADITDYGGTLQIWATGTTTGTRTAQFDDVWLEVPDAPAGTSPVVIVVGSD